MRGTRSIRIFTFLAGGLAVLLGTALLLAWDSLPVSDDPLVRMPGTQPADGVALEGPNRCFNCHGDYNPSVEPGFNWQGSMMAQATRDFLFYSCLTVAAQDSIWAVGRPNATDICLRCHTPDGWLGGRSDPTNASQLAGSDFDGVTCDACHRMYDPFFEETWAHTREPETGDWATYWDETLASDTPSDIAADETHAEDASEAATVDLFNGDPFFINNLPPIDYKEAASGQFFVAKGGDKRASFTDAAARHQMLYSRFHKSRYFCATCHDVSNPVLANLGADPNQPLPTEESSAYSYFHVERTFSEFMLSAYGLGEGADGIGPFHPSVFETSRADNKISKCQDCHMRDVVGKAANKRSTVLRPDESTEHPNSGVPLHDFTGGNAWVPWVLASAVPGSPNHDPINEGLLAAGPQTLTLDLSEGLGLDPAALLAAVDRAKQQLELAATIENLVYDSATGDLSFRIQNQTGHKLISGFPEGRRIFINIEVYSAGQLIWEVNPFDEAAGTLKGLSYTYEDFDSVPLPDPAPLGTNETYVDELVIELHPSSSITGEDESFHFALGDGRYKDNRIPPKGFRIAEAAARMSVPVWHGVEDPNYFSASEYAGGYDDIALQVAAGGDSVEVELYYQTTSREYVEFLRNEINATGALTLPAEAYVVQSDPWFSQLKAWGDTLWQLWKHNMYVDGAAPFEMASAEIGDIGEPCEAPVPTLLTATPGHSEVALTWSNEHSADLEVVGYGVWYDQADKAQLVEQTGLTTSYLDGGLTNGQQYCYLVSSRYTDCDSELSNVLCATPQPPGSQEDIGVGQIETGYYSGRGQNRTWNATSDFQKGMTVVFRAYLVDEQGAPVESAVVELAITGPEAHSLSSEPSDSSGIAEAGWKTKRGGSGTTTGSYTVTVSGVTANGYVWDGVALSEVFTVN